MCGVFIRSSLGCIDHIFALTLITEKANEFGLPVIATIDLQKAFDSVSHIAIWAALAGQGVDLAYIDMLQRLYDGQEPKIQTDRKTSKLPYKEALSRATPSAPSFSTLSSRCLWAG